ncbi:MAG: prohibitin family protein [bacterium]|nr:prohibitin family protein [bacterium]
MTGKKIGIGLMIMVLTLFAINVACGLVSSQSDLGVVAGLGIFIALAVFYVAPAKKFYGWIVKVVNSDSKTMMMVLVALTATVILGSGCARIEPGRVGIKVHLYGGDKGVDVEPLGVGMTVYNPISTSVYEFQTSVQTTAWQGEEAITFASEGMAITAPISLSYYLQADKVPAFFSKFRTDDLNGFTHGFLHNVARDAFNEEASTYTVEQIYAAKKEEFINKVKARVNATTADYGVVIEQFGVVGNFILPPQVMEALNNKIKATQDAIRVENELRSQEAEAKKTVAKAEGEAKARTIQAKAEADANKIVAASITPELVQYQIALKWDGHRPMVEGQSGNLLLNLPLPTAR